MTNKFNFQQSQVLLEDRENINAKIKLLISKLNSLHEEYYKKAYLILNQILILRRRQIKNYGLSQLSREKGLNLTTHQINYIFGYKYISEFSMRKINKNELKISTVLYIIKQSNKFRESEFQDKAVKMYIDGRLNTSQLSRMSADSILNNITSDKEIGIADKQSLRILEYLKTSFKDLEHRENLFSDRNIINQIRLCSERITKQSEHILKFGKGLK